MKTKKFWYEVGTKENAHWVVRVYSDKNYDWVDGPHATYADAAMSCRSYNSQVRQ